MLKRAQSLDKEALRLATENTDLDSIIGHIQFNKQHYCETPLVGGQWVKGKKWPWELELIYSGKHPNIKPTAQMVFPLPR